MLLSLLLFAIDLISSSFVLDYNKSKSFFFKIRVDIALFLGYSVSNSKDQQIESHLSFSILRL